MRLCLALFLIFFIPDVLAANAGTSSTNNSAYYEVLVTILTNVAINLAFLISLIVLLVTGVLFAMKTFDPNSISQRDLKPMSILKFVAGLMLASVLFTPLHSMEFINDLTGLSNSKTGMAMCSVVKINVKHFEWANDAESCISHVEDSFSKVAQYTNKDHVETANFGLLFGIIQLLSIGFMISSCVILAKHIWGFRQVKITVGQALISLVLSSIVFASPNAVKYYEDFKGEQNVVVDSKD
jgi:hypothetical protein